MSVSLVKTPRLVIFIVFIALFVGNLQLSILLPILPDLVLEMNVTPRAHAPLVIGTVIGLGNLAEVLCMPLVILLLKMTGQKWTLTFSSLLQASGCLVLGLLPAYLASLYLGRILQCTGAVFMDIAACALIADYFQVGRSRALASVLHAIPLSYFVSYLLGTWIYHFVGWTVLILSLGIGTALVTGLWFCLPSGSVDDRQPLVIVDRAGKDHHLGLCLSATVLIWVSLAVMDSTAPYDFLTRFDATVWQIGTVMAASVTAQVVAQVYVGERREWFWTFTYVGLTVSGLGLLIYPWIPSFWPTIVTECLVRIGHGLVNTSTGCMVAEIADYRTRDCDDSKYRKRQYNWMYGCHSLCKVVGLTLGALLGGVVVQCLNVRILYWLFGGVLAVSGFLFFVSSKFLLQSRA